VAYRRLTGADLERLEQWRGLGRHMAGYYGQETELTPEGMDRVFGLWLDDDRPKVAPVDFACAFGALLGDCLSERFQFEWARIEDEQGEDFCLKAANGWETYPIQYVWKRVAPYADEDRAPFVGACEMFAGRVPARA